METFGQIIANGRRGRRLGLRNIAEQIIKADGHRSSVGYLDNLEKDLRTPSPGLIPQFAEVLRLPADLLYCALGLFPPGLLRSVETRDRLLSARQIFRQTILAHEGKKRNDRKLVRYEFAPTTAHLLGSNSLLRKPGFARLRSGGNTYKRFIIPLDPENITTHRTNRRIH